MMYDVMYSTILLPNHQRMFLVLKRMRITVPKTRRMDKLKLERDYDTY